MAESLRKRLITEHIIKWIKEERKYADKKYPISTIEQFGGLLRQEDIDFVNRYLAQAQLQGIDTLQGRQALGKACSTIFDFCRSAIFLYGAMPLPALNSGEVKEWNDSPSI